MACGPNLAPGRCEVPPSNGAPMMRMSVPAHEAGSARSAGGTPRNVASGPYMLPSRAMTTSPFVRAECCSADPAVPAPGERHHHAEQYDANPGSSRFPNGPRRGTPGLGLGWVGLRGWSGTGGRERLLAAVLGEGLEDGLDLALPWAARWLAFLQRGAVMLGVTEVGVGAVREQPPDAGG